MSLPWDLVPLIIQNLDHSWKDLASCCLVCSNFLTPSRRRLYSWIRCTSWSGEKHRLIKVLETLKGHSHFCRWILKLEIRTWPFEKSQEEITEIHSNLIDALSNCSNLSEFVFTRKGAFTDEILETICRLPSLRYFEFNGATSFPGRWEVDGLLTLPPLTGISIMLPDRAVAGILTQFLSSQADLSGQCYAPLQRLTVISKESPIISDTVISSMIPFLGPRFTSLGLVGCTKLTDSSLLRLLKTCPGIQELGIESCAISVRFFALAAPCLQSLRALKTTHPGALHAGVLDFYQSINQLAEQCPYLSELTIYRSGDETYDGKKMWPWTPVEFMRRLTEAKRTTLTKFEMHGILVTLAALAELSTVTSLQHLVIHLGRAKQDLEEVISRVSQMGCLKTVHIMHQSNDLTEADMVHMASCCSPSLYQIGMRNRVWTVKRRYHVDTDTDGEVVETTLERYSSPYFPEALLILRS